MTIGERIKNRRMELGLSVEDVAQRLGKNRATIYRYENGFIEDMPSSVLESLARVLLTTPADLLGWDDDLPVLGRVAAGDPIEMILDVSFPESEYNGNLDEYGKLTIHGDSMAPGICDGDTVIIHRQEDAESGDVVIAAINGDAATCKRLKKHKDYIELKPDNEIYSSFIFTPEQVEKMPVRIIGKVVELRRKF